MTKAIPAQLPDCFRWIEDDGGGQRLFLENVEVLEVRQQRNGWVVEIHLRQDRTQPSQIIAVRSPSAGVRWGARWSKLRAPQLAAMVAIRRRYAPRTTPLAATAEQ